MCLPAGAQGRLPGRPMLHLDRFDRYDVELVIPGEEQGLDALQRAGRAAIAAFVQAVRLGR